MDAPENSQQWVIPTRYGTSRVVSSRKLSRLIRKRRLHGLELVRRADGGGWEPLHRMAIFQAVVPHQGDPEQAAMQRFQERLARIGANGVLAFICALVATTLRDPEAMIPISGLLLLVLNVGLWPLLRGLTAPLRQGQVYRRDDLPQRLSALLQPLADKGIPTTQLEEAVLRLHRQRRALEAFDTDEGALEAERVQLRIQQQTAADPRSQALAGRQLAAIEARLAAYAQARTAQARLLAEERDILQRIGAFHQQRRALGGPGIEAAVEEELARVQLEMEAVEEVEHLLQRLQRTPAAH